MIPVRILLAPLLLGLGLVTACSGEPESSVPRVVLVTVDTLRADYVGAYGAKRSHTPTMDRLASNGMRFDAAISPAPLTLPSHTTLLTGLDPPQHGVRANGIYRLGDDVPVITERFRDAGYATAAFLGAVVLDRQYGLARGFDVYDDQMSKRRAADNGYAERTADAVVDSALAWIATAPQRFFLWVHLYDPHANYEAPLGFRMSFPRNPYAAEVAFADSQLGRLLQAIAERFPGDATLIAVTSDHGESLGEHGEVTHALGIYDSTQRIPLLLAGPGVSSGVVVDTPTPLREVGPMLLALSGLDPLPQVPAVSVPIEPGEASQDRYAYVETLATQIHFGWSPLMGIRSQHYKYIRAPRPELYDLNADPHERENIASSAPERVAELEARLKTVLKGDGAGYLAEPLALDPNRRAQLKELGYALPAEPSHSPSTTGLDPKDGLPILHKVGQAMQWMGEGRDAEALELLRDLEPAAFVDLTRSRAALGAGDAPAAERYARAALEGSPRDAEIRVALAQSLEAQGALDAAVEAYEQARDLDGASSETWTGLGRVAEARGQRASAIEYYEAAMQARTRSDEPVWRLAALQIEAGEDARADRLLASISPQARSSQEFIERMSRAKAGNDAKPIPAP